MSKTKISKSLFTPIFQSVLDEVENIHIAAVFGRVWQYCQMTRGYCHAEQETIAYHLHMKRETVNRSLKVLVEAGYLEDTTPNTKGRTRIYRDTGKAGTILLPEAMSEDVSGVVSGVVSVPVSVPVTLSHTKNLKTLKTEKTLLLPSGSGEFINSSIQEQEQSQELRNEKNKGSAKELAFFADASDEQAEAYRLVRQVSNIDTAIEKAMSENPIEAAISLLEWHRDNGTTNSRTASALLEKINKAERREESISRYESNVKDVQSRFVKEVTAVFGKVTNGEMNDMYTEYIGLCEQVYEGDKYDMFADGEYNRTGTDDRAHYERIELYVKQRGEREDAAADALEAAERVNSSLNIGIDV